MGLIHIMERGGSDYHEYKKAVKDAKRAIETICELTEEMEDEYGYGERRGGSYRMREDWRDAEEHRSRMR